MKQIKISLVFIFALLCFTAQAQDLPQPSPLAKLEQKVGLTDVSIVYSRPSVNDRTVWDDLVPYGKVWRTGANASTLVEVSTDVKINGKDLPKGKYALFTIPNKDSWTLIFNTDTGLWGADGYDAAKNALTVEVKPEKSPMFVESLMFTVGDIKTSEAKVALWWENTMVPFSITVDVDKQAQENIKNAIAELDRGFRVYNSSAAYLLNANKDPKMALEYAKKSVSMQEKFWNVYTLSKAYAANGMYKEAIETAKKSKEMAEKADYAPYVKMNEENIAMWKKSK